MNGQSSTVEIANVAPAIRQDLRFSLQQHGDQPCYLIEDEKNSRFYRIGIPEYTFISLLDGTTSIREAMAHTAALLGKDAFAERDAASICKWLVDCQLAHTSASLEFDRLLGIAQKSATQKRWQQLNPIMIRVPLFRPDHLLSTATRWLGWWVSWPAFFVWLAICGLAIHQLLTHWSTAEALSGNVLTRANFFYLLLVWCVLKVFHELSHGIACKKFGGHIREAGLLLIALAPIPYVDVTSAWRFSSKWQRIFVSAAGMYTELFIAALATLVWIHTESPVVQQQAYNVMITASLITLLFNANPLMRFDGYYMLSDWLELPNLYGLGQQFTRYLGRRYLLGVPAKMPSWPLRKAIIVRVYGLAAFVWRIIVCVSIFCAAATLFKGAGIVMALVGGLLWLGVPLFQFVKYLIQGNTLERPKLTRFAMAGSILAAAVVGLLMLPEPGGTRAPAVVAYQPLHVVRAPYAGFIREVHVSSGQQVGESAPLLVIENKDLRAELAELRIERLLSEQRSRVNLKDGDVAAEQVEAEMRAALTAEIDEREEQLRGSLVVAPAGGHIVSRDVESLLGSFVAEGNELLAIGDERYKEIVMAVAQQDVETFSQNVGATLAALVHTPGVGLLECQLDAVDPRASQQLEQVALGAHNGGPLAVEPVTEQQAGGDAQQQWQLVEPHFVGQVKLSTVQAERLRSGQLATIRLAEARGTLGQMFYRGVSNWVEARWQRVRD